MSWYGLEIARLKGNIVQFDNSTRCCNSRQY